MTVVLHLVFISFPIVYLLPFGSLIYFLFGFSLALDRLGNRYSTFQSHGLYHLIRVDGVSFVSRVCHFDFATCPIG